MNRITSQKQDLRQKIKWELSLYTKDQLSNFDTQLVVKIFDRINTDKYTNIGVFSPRVDEPDISSVYSSPRRLFFLLRPKIGIELHWFFPRISDGGELEMVQAVRKDQFEKGKFDLMQPTKDLSATNLNNLDVIFIPGLAFDESGNRLGRGKGFYDKLLTRLSPSTKKIGICFSFQKIDKVPTEERDQKVDEVITNDA